MATEQDQSISHDVIEAYARWAERVLAIQARFAPHRAQEQASRRHNHEGSFCSNDALALHYVNGTLIQTSLSSGARNDIVRPVSGLAAKHKEAKQIVQRLAQLKKHRAALNAEVSALYVDLLAARERIAALKTHESQKELLYLQSKGIL